MMEVELEPYTHACCTPACAYSNGNRKLVQPSDQDNSISAQCTAGPSRYVSACALIMKRFLCMQIRQSYRESRDFSKWSDDVPPEAKDRCFVVFYGSEFNLKTLSCLTLYESDCAVWCQGLTYLMEDVRRASNRLHQVKKWLHGLIVDGDEKVISSLQWSS